MRAVFVVHMSAVRLARVNHPRRGSLSIRIMQEVNQELVGSVSGDLVSETKYFEVADAADQTVWMYGSRLFFNAVFDVIFDF